MRVVEASARAQALQSTSNSTLTVEHHCVPSSTLMPLLPQEESPGCTNILMYKGQLYTTCSYFSLAQLQAVL